MSAFRHRVVVVDDDPGIRELVVAMLEDCQDLEVVATCTCGADAVEAARKDHPDVIVMDVDMPTMDGPTATARILEENPSTRVLAFTGHTDGSAVVRMIAAGAVGYAVKGASPDVVRSAVREAASRQPHVDPAALPGLFNSLVDLVREERERRLDQERLTHSIEAMFDDTVRALAGALHSRDRYTGDHDDRVAATCVCTGRKLGISGPELVDLRYGGIFHDIGKIGVPDRILHKTSKLDEEEWAIIKQHTILGEEILKPIGFLRNAGRIVRHSHEHWDGSGYPDGLEGEQIPLAARIVFTCDAWDAITTDRTYQAARSPEEAIEIMRSLSNVHFDPVVVEALVEVVRGGEQASLDAEPVNVGMVLEGG